MDDRALKQSYSLSFNKSFHINAKQMAIFFDQSLSSYIEDVVNDHMKLIGLVQRRVKSGEALAVKKDTVTVPKKMLDCAKGFENGTRGLQSSVEHFFWLGVQAHNQGIKPTDDAFNAP